MSRAVEESNRRMLRARDAMDRTYSEPLDVPALARIAHVTEAHFIRTFKATFGETPHRYLQRRRVERSMFLLRETDRSITDVCMDVGFSSLGTFSRTFQVIMGESPSAYRKRVSAAQAAHAAIGRAGVNGANGAGTGAILGQARSTGYVGAMTVPTCFAMAWTRPASTTGEESSIERGEPPFDKLRENGSLR